MEQENNVLNMEEKLEELKSKAQEDLKDAQTIEYAIDQEDVNVVNTLKSKLEAMKKKFETQKTDNEANINKFNRQNKLFLDFFAGSLATITDTELSALIKENMDTLTKTIENNNNSLKMFEKTEKVISDAIEVITYKINDDGKAYLNEDVIKLARLIMNS